MPIACDSIRRARPLLGTFVEISAAGGPPEEMDAAVAAAFAAVAKAHNLMSFHEASSDVSHLNAQASAAPVCVHAWTFQVLQAACDLHRRSSGVFDIAIAPVLQDMGLLPCVRHVGSASPCSPATTQDIELLPGRHVRFRNSHMKIDLGGIAKGFAVDRAIDVLRAGGMSTILVNAGGDLAAFGPSAHLVQLRDPRNPARLLGRLHIRNEALASSGGRLDPFVSPERIGPTIIDPRSRKRVRAIAGATVRASSCMLADALTKVAMIEGRSAGSLLDYYRAGALLVSKDGDLMTRDFESALCLAA